VNIVNLELDRSLADAKAEPKSAKREGGSFAFAHSDSAQV